MQFSNTILVLAGLLSLTSANPAPQTPAQTTAAAEALASYILDVATGTAIQGALSALETDPAAESSFTKVLASISSVLEAKGTLAPNYMDAVPSQVRPFFSSLLEGEASILTANGFKNPIPTNGLAQGSLSSSSAQGQAQETSSSKAAAPRETGLGRVSQVAVAGAVGFVGVVMAL